MCFSNWTSVDDSELQRSVPVSEMCMWLVFFEIFEETLCRLVKRLIFGGLHKNKNCSFPSKWEPNQSHMTPV